ncbi:MAG: caspase family protein [Bradyrhizobium sp.]|uniref:caspase family protein n=1 Tax=Bradyrhizobium sp. TaxID=376 RepID=UPI002719FAA4|nr:caspase family protein [Bradyrhizobium sp.]MDO8399627.1 caspase family protein [Bradyrhizobium sp.]
MRAVGTIFLTVWLTSLFGQPALAEKRVALVIGNSGYQNVARLTNPANDAATIAGTLKKAGFDIVNTRSDLKAAEMRRALRDFGNKTHDADVALIYYAGHGIELDNTNYLIPVDARLETDVDVYDETISLDRVFVAIESAKRLRLIILDACRDNPFSKIMRRSAASRTIGRGLAKVEPTNPNTMIAFAAKAGFIAFDGDGTNSPFAAALSKHLATPGLDLRKAFGFVRDDVLKATDNKQEPYIYGSLGGDDVLLVPAKAAVSTPGSNSQAEMRRDYELALQIGSRAIWASFLNQHPSGFYADLARGHLEKIASKESRVAAAEKLRLVQEDSARLATENAKQAEQTKAATQAKAADDARLVAEKVKQVQQAKAAAAEQARFADEKASAEMAAAMKAEADKAVETRLAGEKAAANRFNEEKLVTEKATSREATAEAKPPEPKVPQQVASLPTETASAERELSSREIAQSIHTELRRVGCFSGSVDGEWNAASRRSLDLFNARAGTKLDGELARLEVLKVIKEKPAHFCRLTCDHGFKADGERCVTMTCGAGLFLNGNNECERKLKKRSAARYRPERAKAENEPAKPRTSEPYCSMSAMCDRTEGAEKRAVEAFRKEELRLGRGSR